MIVHVVSNPTMVVLKLSYMIVVINHTMALLKLSYSVIVVQ
jgi:hypothetical protein